MPRAVRSIVHAWLRMDFFGDPRRDGGSALTSTIFSQAFFALVLAALLFDPGQRTVPFAAANLSLSTLLVGIGALADPQRTLRRRAADRALLATAPLPRATIATARAVHGAFYVVLITTGMAIPPAILASRLQDGSLWSVPAYLLHASLLAGLCAGALALVLRIAERVAGRGAALLLAGTLRALLLGGGFVAFAVCLRALDGSTDDLPLGRAGAWAWPPYWSARWLAQPTDAVALAALAGLTAVLLLGNAVVAETERPRARVRRARRFDPAAAAERWCAGPSNPLRGATRFVAAMLYRSPSFRARVLPLLGVPIAMTILAFTDVEGRGQRLLLGMTFQFPAVYLPFLIGFLPHAERAGVGHVFATSPFAGAGLARAASLIALETRVLQPVLGVAALLALVADVPWTVVVPLWLFSNGAAILLAGFQLRALDAMPFTTDAAEETEADLGGMIGLAIVLATTGGLFALVADHPLGWLAALAVAGAGLHSIQRHARFR